MANLELDLWETKTKTQEGGVPNLLREMGEVPTLCRPVTSLSPSHWKRWPAFSPALRPLGHPRKFSTTTCIGVGVIKQQHGALPRSLGRNNQEPWRSLTAYRRSDTEEEGNNPRDPQVGWNHRMVALGEPRLFKLRRGFKLILLSHFIFCRLPSYALHLAHTLEGVLPPNFGFRKVKKALKSCLKTKITIKIKRVETSMMNRSCSSFSLKSQSKDDSVSENAKGIRQAWSFNLQPIRLKLMVLQGEFAFWRELSLCPPSETARVVCILKN
ncbi:uncharacterized protein [Equus przewalskii]|uniref:Uncharacterized protein n=1 Tax=Equus przewalskii TaxID=9798 RepID=A0ABM4L339_EQUPR